MTTTASAPVTLSNQVYMLRDVMRQLTDGRWTLGPARDSSREWQRQLIDSVIHGYPTGQLVIANIGDEQRVLDGSRRLRTIHTALTQPGWSLDRGGDVLAADQIPADESFPVSALCETMKFLPHHKTLAATAVGQQVNDHAERAARTLLQALTMPVTFVTCDDEHTLAVIRNRLA